MPSASRERSSPARRRHASRVEAGSVLVASRAWKKSPAGDAGPHHGSSHARRRALSLRNAVYHYATDKRAVMALATETLRYLPFLQKVVREALPSRASSAAEDDPKMLLECVVVYDLLIGGGLRPDGLEEKRVLASPARGRIEAAWKRLLSANGLPDDASPVELLPKERREDAAARASFPRYVRINLTFGREEAARVKQRLIEDFSDAYHDPLLPDVMCLPPIEQVGTRLVRHPLVRSGRVILQVMGGGVVGPS